MIDTILHEMQELTLGDKRRLIEATKAAVARELGFGAGDAPAACPRCGSADFVRKGHGRDGSQRWLCRGCGRAFSRKTMGLLALSKLPPETWRLYVERMLQAGGSLRACAAACHVSLRTSWFMRMRICEVMEKGLQPFRTGPSISWQVDGTCLDESLSGNRKRAAVKMPRAPHRHGGSVHERGISNQKVCIVCGANSLGDSFCRVVGRGRPTDRELESSLPSFDGSPVETDGHKGYARVLPGLGASSVSSEAGAGSHGGLGLVNALHQRLKRFLAKFSGISTRCLVHCLAWFEWTEQARRSDALQSEILPGQAAQGRYDNTRRMLTDKEQPFWGWWEQESCMSTVV